MLLTAGCSLNEVGHICLSKRRLNAVASNVIGAAAYSGSFEVMSFAYNRAKTDMIDVKAIETADRRAEKNTFKYELHDFTPLQLAIVSPNSDLNVVKFLLSKEANQMIKVSSTQDNILHLAAKYCKNFDVLQYLVQNCKLNIFERNAQGDTVLTICQANGNTKGVELIEQVQDIFDDSSKKTDELLAELMGEEEKNDKAKQKKKEKKQRSRLSKLAQMHNCTIEELEEVFAREEQERQR